VRAARGGPARRVVLLALVAGGVAAWGAAGASGVRGVAPATVSLPPGVTELVLAEDGSRAAAVTVTFDRQRGLPERAVVVVEAPAGRVLWRANLPAVSCCDFPVFSTTPDVRQLALGGARGVEVFRSDGVRVASLDLGQVGSLNSALQLWSDGRGLVAGQVDGELKAFALPAPRLLWRAAVGSALLGLVLNEASGEVLSLTAEGFVALEGRRGTLRYRVRARGVPVAAAFAAGRGFVVAWKGADEVLGVGFLEGGSWRWQRRLGRVTVPLLEGDPSARWVAVSDFLGHAAWLLGAGGRLLWSADGTPAAVGLDRQGLAALVTKDVLEVRAPGAGAVRWRTRLPGRAHLVRLSGGVLAVLGSQDMQAVLPDRMWLWRVSR
jgi:hypothetical protein